MKVKLISFSQPVEDIGVQLADAQDLVAYCARVSNPDNQYNTETSDRLVKYLMKHKHWSPLEMVSACLEIETTRDIARQILRHRSFSFQEFSQRYADPTLDLTFDYRHARIQDDKNRQNSIENQDLELEAQWCYKQQQIIDAADFAYRWARSEGIAKEVARSVLPEGNTMSRMYMNGTLRSWVHYIEVRSAPGTQQEHIQVAEACAKELAKIFPQING